MSPTAGHVSPTAPLDELLPEIDAGLIAACKFTSDCPDRLAEAIRYSLLAPGKRLRPALVLMACEAVGGSRAQALPAAVAVEMIHAYSLVHDDLPAMDDDDLRRGRPTTHIAFDEATAILAGDALQALAFSHLCRSVDDPVLAYRCVAVLSQAAGPEALVGGQADDLAAEAGGERTLAQLEGIHRRKTGALFEASVRLGGLLGGADDASLDALDRYAKPLGLAFQVVDDCLDHTSTQQAMGKRIGKDQRRGKLTYPSVLGLEESQQLAERLVTQAVESIDVFGIAAWRLKWLAQFVLRRTH